MMNEFIKNVEEVAENFKKALVKMGINLQDQKVGGYIETHGMMHPDEVVWPSSKRMPLQPTKAEVDQVAKNNEHLNHPFYKKVDEITEKVAKGQILKGAAKYDEPFNPDSWTGEELGNHALEELRDGQVYVVGMVEKIKGLEQENRILKNEIEALELENNRLDRLNKGKSFTPTITVNLNGNVDPDFDGVKVAEQLAEQIKKGLSSL